MKFSEQLSETRVPEWRDAYIDYATVKKLVNEAGLSRLNEQSSSPLQTLSIDKTPESLFAPDYNLASSTPSFTIPTLTLKSPDEQEPPTPLFIRSPTTPISARPKPKRPDLKLQIGSTIATVIAATAVNPSFRFSQHVPIEDIWEELTTQEQAFFTFLEKEFEKVEHFFHERETKALERFQTLRLQLDRLEEHREKLVQDEFTQLSGEDGSPHSANSALNSSTSSNKRQPERRRSMLHIPLPYTTSHRKTLRPDEYFDARSRLKTAFVEFYQLLDYIHSYQLVNHTGFLKATGKFTKHTKIPTTLQWTPKLNKAHFVSSETVQELLSSTEVIFTKHFEQGSRKKAMQRLHATGKATTSYYDSVVYSGFMLGMSIFPLVDGIRLIFANPAQIPYLSALLQIYGAFLLPTLMAAMIPFNMIVWKRARIHYTMIFDVNRHTMIQYRKSAELPMTLLCLLTFCFWISMEVTTVKPYVWPIVWLVVAVLLVINPLKQWNRTSRFWFLRGFGRLLTIGFIPIQFREFYIASALVSVSYTFYALPYLWCAYSYHWVPNVHKICAINHWSKPFLSSVPNMLSIIQYLRRYYDSKRLLHLFNALKMTISIVTIYVYYNWRTSGGNWDSNFALWAVFATINSLYLTYWDIRIDWNLLNRNSKYWMIRNNIAYYPSFYYFAIIANILLRFTWVIYLNSDHPEYAPLKSFLSGLIEVVRRSVLWNLLRVENEHQGNTDAYRATKDVPLPYTTSNDDDEKNLGMVMDAAEAAREKQSMTVSKAKGFLEKTGLRRRRKSKSSPPMTADDEQDHVHSGKSFSWAKSQKIEEMDEEDVIVELDK